MKKQVYGQDGREESRRVMMKPIFKLDQEVWMVLEGVG